MYWNVRVLVVGYEKKFHAAPAPASRCGPLTKSGQQIQILK
jgi:hypothetical protein